MLWPHVAHGLTSAQRLTAVFAVPTAIGAVAALVVNLRKQDLTEGQDRRAVAAAFTERFRSASEQLGERPVLQVHHLCHAVRPSVRSSTVIVESSWSSEWPSDGQRLAGALMETIATHSRLTKCLHEALLGRV